MDKFKFNLFLAVFTFLCFSVYPWFQATSPSFQLAVSSILIFLLGIPHGAIDHVVYFKAKKRGVREVIIFYVVYLGLMAAYTICWLIWPYASLIFFLGISAYHFGQSQFSYLEKDIRSILRITLYTAWGGSLLLGLVYYHYDQIISDLSTVSYFQNLESVLSFKALRSLFISLTISSVLLLVFYLPLTGKRKAVIVELINFGLIHFIFYTMPPILGFTIYFVFWHSLRVLFDEYDYLKDKISNLDPMRFLKILTPHSLISIFGAILLIFSFYYFEIEISPIILILVFLSVLTLPHTLVMNRLYRD